MRRPFLVRAVRAWPLGPLSIPVLLMGALIASSSIVSAALASNVVELHILFTSDIHGYIGSFDATWMSPNFPPVIGGGASTATYVQSVRKRLAGRADAGLLLIDNGDIWQGSPIGTMSQGEVMVDFYNVLDYDLVAIGNHEFDAGWQNERQLSLNLHHKMVCCNLLDAKTGELVDWVEPYRIFERAGLRVGFIGAITPSTEHMAFGENIAGLEFAPIAPSVEKYRDILKNEKGVDLVLLSVHNGLPYPGNLEREWQHVLDDEKQGVDLYHTADSALELAHVIRGIPAMFGGHTHQGYQKPWIDPYTHVMFFEPYARGTAVGHVILKVDRATGTVVGYELGQRGGDMVTLYEDQFWPDPEVQEKLRPWMEKVQAELKQVVGRSTVNLSRSGRFNSPMGNLVTEAMRDAFDADLAFTNSGGLRTDIPRGEISMGQLLELLPFGNSLAVVEMDGRMVRRVLERKSGRRSSGLFESGAQLVVDPMVPEGERVLECRIGAEPLQPDKIYRVVTTDYLMEGNSGFSFLTTIDPERVSYTQVLTRDAVVRYLQKHSPVSPRADDRYQERSGAQVASYLRGWDVP